MASANPRTPIPMLSRNRHEELDHVPDHVDPDSYYRIDPNQYGFLHRRSTLLNFYGIGLGFVAVAALGAYLVGQPELAQRSASIPGLADWSVLGVLAATTWGVTRRTAWGRWLGMAFATLCMAQVAWYLSSPRHWALTGESLGMGARFALGYLGWLSCVGTQALFGADGFSHGLVRWAHLRDQQERQEQAEVFQLDGTASGRDRAA